MATVAATIIAVMSLAGAVVCAADKRAAKRGARRVPERTLWLLGVFGGAAGVWIAMLIAHHKTHKAAFAVLMPMLTAAQLALLVWLCLKS